MLNSDRGCTSTRTGVIGMFLDVDAPLAEFSNIMDHISDELARYQNELVPWVLLFTVAVAILMHYWSFKIDEGDRTAPPVLWAEKRV